MLYLVVYLFAAVAIVSGIASLVAVFRFIAGIYDEMRNG